MNLKKMMIITLLIFLTIGAVSASDDNTTSDALTFEEDMSDVSTQSVDDNTQDLNNDLLNVNEDENSLTEWDSNSTPMPRSNSTITIEVEGCSYGEDAVVNVNVSPQEATGFVSLIVDGVMISNVSVIAGQVHFNISGLISVGDHSATVIYSGDEHYYNSTASSMFSVSKASPTILTEANDIYVGDDANVMVTVPNDATGNIKLSINGNDFNDVIVDGKCPFTIPDLEVGTYNVTATYLGDYNYNSAFNSTQFRVRKNSFSKLQELINDASDSLTLDRDYYGEGSEISITKTITIDGQGHTLDAQGLSRIFNVNANGVALTNLNLVNASADTNGGAIIVGASSNIFIISNILFSNNTAENGGAVYIGGMNAQIFNANFSYNTAGSRGGAIYWAGNSGIMNTSTFINNYASENGGAIYLAGESPVIANAYFSNNKAYLSNGGAVYITGHDAYLEGDLFESNTAENGGAVYGVNGTLISNSLFTNNYAGELGGAIYNCYYENSNFTSNSEPEIYFDPELRKETPIEVEVTNITVGETLSVIITLLNNASMPVTVLVDGEIHGGLMVDCIGVYNITDLNPGKHLIIVQVNATMEYMSNATAIGVNVLKHDLIINMNCDNINVGEDAIINIILNANTTGYAAVEVSGRNYTVNIGDGEGNLAICNLPAGTYDAYAFFPGNDLYNSANTTLSFTVFKVDLDVDVDFKNDDKTIKITPLDNISGNLTFKIAGGNYVFSSQGLTVDLNSFASGNYSYTIIYAGDDKYNPYSTSGNIALTRKVPAITVNVDDVSYGQTANVNFTLPWDARGVVNFILRDDSSQILWNYSLETNENVTVTSLPIPGLGAGKYILNMEYSGDRAYESAVVMANFTVSKYDLNVDVDFKNDVKTIKITPLDNISANLTFTIADKNYVFSSKGLTVDLNSLASGNYTYTISYAGDDKYNPYSTSGNITLTRKVPAITVNVDDVSYGQTANVNFTLPWDARGVVNFILSDNSSQILWNYSLEINENDTITSLPIPGLGAGKYILNMKYSGDRAYESAVVMANFTVSKYDLNVDVDFKNDVKTIKITPLDNISGNLTFTIAGKNYVFSSKGLTVDLNSFASGNYSYTIIYAGDDKYNPYSTSGNITLTRKVPAITVNVDDVSYGQTANVNFTLPWDARGVVNFILRDDSSQILRNYSLEINENDTITSLPIPGLGAGKYILNMEYAGNRAYESAVALANFTVSKYDLNVDVDFKNDDKTIKITPLDDIGGNLTFTIANVNYVVPSQGLTIDLNSFASGNYSYTISYAGDDKYNPYSTSKNITLTREEINVTVNADNITYGESQNITARVPDGATSEVNFLLFKNEEIILNTTSQVINGTASYLLPSLDAGTYLLKASYIGDSRYEKSSFFEKTFKVNPNIAVSPQVTVGDDGKIVIEVGNVDGTISVYVDGVMDGSRGIKNNKFTYNLPTEDYSVGFHNLTFQYSGTSLDANVFSYWDEQTGQYIPTRYLINITQRQTETAADSDNDNNFRLVLKNDNDTVLSNATGTVEFIIVDEFAREVGRYVVDVVNGIADLDISKYKNGNYIIKWSYSGDEKHTAISRELRLSITHKASRITAADISLQYTVSKKYSVTVYGTDGKALSNAKIQFSANGKILGTTTTNAKGVAAIMISNVPGDYKLTITAPGLSITKKMKVSHILTLNTVKVKRSAKKLVLTATLKKVNGKFLKNQKITFKFNGKKYTAKTNKKGVVKFTIKKSVLKKLKAGKKVKYQATYLKDTVKKTVKVKK